MVKTTGGGRLFRLGHRNRMAAILAKRGVCEKRVTLHGNPLTLAAASLHIAVSLRTVASPRDSLLQMALVWGLPPVCRYSSPDTFHFNPAKITLEDRKRALELIKERLGIERIPAGNLLFGNQSTLPDDDFPARSNMPSRHRQFGFRYNSHPANIPGISKNHTEQKDFSPWSASGALRAKPSTLSNNQRDIVYACVARTITVSVSAIWRASLRRYARSCSIRDRLFSTNPLTSSALGMGLILARARGG
jgi:hypothetical protein